MPNLQEIGPTLEANRKKNMTLRSKTVRVDEVVVAWGIVSDPGETPSSGVVLRVNPDGNVDPVAILNELESLQRSGDVSPGADPTTFILRQQFNHFSWGADAATLTFFMWAAGSIATGVASSALYEGLKEISKKFIRRKSTQLSDPPLARDSDDVRIAMNAVESLFELPPGRLTAELISRDSDSAIVQVHNVTGERFRVQTVWTGNGGALTRVDKILEQ